MSTLSLSVNANGETLGAIAGYKKHGVLKSTVAYMMLNHFHYPEEFKDTLSKYYIIHWRPKYFREQLCDGILVHQSEEYIVVYHKLSVGTLGKARMLKLSFRAAAPAYSLPAYVLVSEAKE